MRSWAGWAVPILVHACGGQVDEATLGQPGAGVGGASGSAGSDGTAGADPGSPGAGRANEAGSAGSFVDPGCPMQEPPPPVNECDPLSDFTGCPPGLACYPFVQHPAQGSGCGQQVYGAICFPEGTGEQGARCGEGSEPCAAGFICVVGARAGSTCARLCPLDGPNDCPDGMVCSSTDVEGYGVCS